jgi:hypothetical protein
MIMSAKIARGIPMGFVLLGLVSVICSVAENMRATAIQLKKIQDGKGVRSTNI